MLSKRGEEVGRRGGGEVRNSDRKGLGTRQILRARPCTWATVWAELQSTPAVRRRVRLSNRAPNHMKLPGPAFITLVSRAMLPWMVTTLGYPEKAATSAQSRSVPCP
jgi:hypothetical protein